MSSFAPLEQWHEIMSEPILDYVFTPHALTGMRRRNIDKSLVAEVIASPE